MSFYLQDPGNPATKYLVELLLEESKRSTGGGAWFAWATRRGINLLLEHQDFIGFMESHPFDLVVGVDAVTDESALRQLALLDSNLSHLSVSIFMNPYSDVLFHPKVCWFEHDSGGTIIAGSGNLTEGGLSRNWEAFTVTTVTKSEIQTVKDSWVKWRSDYRPNLFPPTDHEVVARAKENKPVRQKSTQTPASKKKRLGRVRRGNRVPFAPPTARDPNSNLDVLIAEIPKGSTRWNQANFDLENYKSFFGAKPDEQRYMFFRHVQPDGSVGETEVRPSVAVKSHNWRFELAAGHGRLYPATGRPIGVFVRQASRNFLYVLLMPGEPGHGEMDRLLSKNWRGSVARVRRIRDTSATLARAWPSSPLLSADPEEPVET